jgi:hypothetical protein
MQHTILQTLREFAESVKAKFSAAAEGEPEAQLSGPVSSLLEAIGKVIHRRIVAKAESALGDRLGIPDFGVVADGTLCGYVELKAPGEGADTSRYRGRNRAQWERFRSQPNIIYTDGNEWGLYQNGEPAERLLRLAKDVTKHGAKGVTEADADLFQAILTKFLAWAPIVPEKPREQAALLAPLCRLLREDVAEALRDPESPLGALAKDWRALLFPEASDERFADAYAQTVTFALLLARSEGADVADLSRAVAALEAGHTLLSRALQVLTDARSRKEIEPSLLLLQRVINAFPERGMKPAEEDPWLYFYEHFLSSYDPKLRKDSGVYYTPVEVVKCQVALVDALLRDELGKDGGFVHKDVITLDPAVGTGTYLLGVIEHALAGVAATEGAGMVKARAATLAGNLFGFEIMVGPYAVSELRLTRALKDRGATIGDDGLGVYLADTLESPFGKPPALPTFFEPIAEQHRKALHVKDKKSVIVCLGNPPYDRHPALGENSQNNRARTGGWVRWGKSGKPENAILDAFVKPAKDAGHGGDVKNLYNLYIYFWRWALWKVFEHASAKAAGGAGVVTFITAASYIRGDAFVGVRETLRRLCHEVWVIDLGGEGRGTRQDDNVFNIQTPVAICVAFGRGAKDRSEPATVKYTRIRGTRDEKYAELAAVGSFNDLTWKDCPADWHAPLRPKGTGSYFTYPDLKDLMPWQSNGVQLKRLWPIAPSEELLRRRWKALLLAEDRGKAMKESGDRTVRGVYNLRLTGQEWPERQTPIGKLKAGAACPPITPYAYRSFDREFLIADVRLIARPREPLWFAHGDAQLYFTSLFTNPVGDGPCLSACSSIPDMHHFRGSFGAKDAFPLYRDAAAQEPNILPGLLELWGGRLKRDFSAADFAAYVYALLAHPGFADRFYDELEDCEVRVPLTLDSGLFGKAVAAGQNLLFLHTYGERFTSKDRQRGRIPRGAARCTEAVSDEPTAYPDHYEYVEAGKTLRVGAGTFAPVAPEVWAYEVSGLHVVDSWLGYRMKDRKGKKSSPLDHIHPERWAAEFTEELLRLLWILEHTIAMHADLADLLAQVCAGPLLSAFDLPGVAEAARRPPRAADGAGLFDDEEDENGEDLSEDEAVA